MFTDEQEQIIIDSITEQMSRDYAGPWNVMVGGYKVTVLSTPDELTEMSDYEDCYGKVAWIGRNSHHDQRPDGFDGAAMKVWTQSDVVWWQPPAYIKNDAQTLSETAMVVKDILSYGFHSYSMVITKICECCQQSVQVDQTRVGGWEPFSDDHANKVSLLLENLRG